MGHHHRGWEHGMRVRNRNKGIAAVAAGLLVGGLLSGVAVDSAGASGEGRPAAGEARHPDRPTRVVQIVLDQLRPEFIDAFHMKNVKRLMRGGAAYPNAYLGHMASETVVSHNVMTSGMLPKHMGWSDEWYPRRPRACSAPAGDRYVTGSMASSTVRHPDRGQGLPQAGRLPARGVPGQDGGRDRGEELRRAHDGRTGCGHADHVRRPHRRLRRRPERARRPHLAWPGRRRGADVHLQPRRAAGSTSTPTARLDYGTLDDLAGLDVPACEGNRDVPGFDPDAPGR